MNIEENYLKIGYEDTDEKVKMAIYGLEFELNAISEEDVKKIDENKNDIAIVDKLLKTILGENAIELIDEKRVKDGYEKMDLMIKMTVITIVFKTYFKELTKKTQGMIKQINGSFNKQHVNNNEYRNNRNNRNNYNNNYRNNYRR